LTIDELKEKASGFTPQDLAQISTDAYAYAVRNGHEVDAAAYSNWYVEGSTSDENAGWNNLPQHLDTFASWMTL
jgi:hypothetical protein